MTLREASCLHEHWRDCALCTLRRTTSYRRPEVTWCWDCGAEFPQPLIGGVRLFCDEHRATRDEAQRRYAKTKSRAIRRGEPIPPPLVLEPAS